MNEHDSSQQPPSEPVTKREQPVELPTVDPTTRVMVPQHQLHDAERQFEPITTLLASDADNARAQAASGGTAPFAGYDILGEIGRGAMGVVYKARDVRLNRLVALKVALNGVDSRGLIRFLAEAEVVAAVHHRNVVQVYAYGEEAGCPFLALEFCSSGTLSDYFNNRQVDIQTIVRVLAKVAAGVAAAHEAGVVHRDLKPSNVLFDDSGEPRVADFGLAKRGASDLTVTGAVMGTPAYMSPEQAEGQTKFVGPQADVWALGVMLYEGLTGRKPFEGSNITEILRVVCSETPVSIRKLVPGIPRDLDTIVNKCLSKNPNNRYPTAAELADDLHLYLEGKAIRARPLGMFEAAWRSLLQNRFDAEFAHWGNTILLMAGVNFTYHVVLHVLRESKQAYWLRLLTHCVGMCFLLGLIQINRLRVPRMNQLTKQLVTIIVANFAAYGVIDVVVWQMNGGVWPFDDVQMYPYFFVLNGLCFCILGSSHFGLLSGLGVFCWVIALILPFVLDYAYLVNAVFWAITLGCVGIYFRRLSQKPVEPT